MSEAQRRPGLTGDDLLRMPRGTGQRYELVEGALWVMEPPGVDHGRVAANAAFLLRQHAEGAGLGRVVGETGFFTRGGDATVRAPDVAFLSYERFPPGPLPKGYGRVAPDLVVEVVSPHDRPRELEQKTREWLDFGVRAVWEVDPERRQVRVSTAAGAAILEEGDLLQGGDAVPGFAVPVRELFED
jgi:Uma2 family endonuclease